MSPPFCALWIEQAPAGGGPAHRQWLDAVESARRFGSFSIDSAPHLNAASKRLAERAYDVLVLDVGAVPGNELETVRRLLVEAPELPVVAVTRSLELELATAALSLGVEDVVAADESSPELLARALRYAIERRRAQKQLYAALKEKEVLLHELHHRAKNNLQVISSLLSMQARRERDARFHEIVAAAQRRIDAIALAHEKLHQAPDLSRIDFSGYIGALARAVHLSYGGETRGIGLELSLDCCELPLQEAVPTGLVVNELLMNAFKHAFPEGRPGTIRVSTSRKDACFSLEIADDGVGIPSTAKHDPRRLGLEIVMTLAEQLDATLVHESGSGTCFRLSFACSEGA
jgi:two-component sensor histidine kinase